jgi:acyl-CoA thioesterase FadM
MADVDGARILYFTSPYRWMEAQFTTWLADVGRPLVDLLEAGEGMPVVSSGCVYHRPVRLDDVVRQELLPVRVGRASFTLECAITRQGDDEPSATVTAVHVWSVREPGGGGRFAPASIPVWLRDLLAR